jgi:two-component system nitrogen regulation response regulator NtrX
MNAKKIILIEDEKKLLDLLVFNLQSDYNVEGYTDAESFLEAFEPEDTGAIITDVRLPGIDGLELLDKVRKSASHIPVIIITAYGSIGQAVSAIKMGAYDYLTKPVSVQEIRQVIERASQFISSIDIAAPLFPRDSKFITNDSLTLKQCELAAKASPMKVPILILGETGTGKELIAELIHNASKREGNFVKINCAAIPSELLEGELFGYKKGAFTGADSRYEGKLRLADGGTLFLDEIGDMQESLQAKLLRVIETESFYPVGENTLCNVDLRVVAATNRDLKNEVEKGRFRSDLYYRLSVVPVRVPPLRERPKDIRIITKAIFEELQREGKTSSKTIDEEVFSVLESYHWPGNVRELRNVITHMVLLTPDKRITVNDLPEELVSTGAPNCEPERIPQTYEELKQMKREVKDEMYAELEIGFLRNALIKNQWNISKTAEAVGIDRRLLQNMIKKHGLRRKDQN